MAAPTGVFLSSKIPFHSLFLTHSHSSHFNFQALQRFLFFGPLLCFVLFLIPSTSFISFESKHLHHLLSPTCCLSISLTPPCLRLIYHAHLMCVLPPTCCMSTLFAYVLPSLPCMPTSACLLHVRLINACSTIITLHAYFHLLVACPPHSCLLHHRRLASFHHHISNAKHLFHHNCLVCLLPPTCCLIALFAYLELQVCPLACYFSPTCLCKRWSIGSMHNLHFVKFFFFSFFFAFVFFSCLFLFVCFIV